MRQQLLAASNLVMGTANILLVDLPDDWRVLRGPYAPEVDRWTEQAGRRWMSQGQAAYRLVAVSPEAPGQVRAEVELSVAVAPRASGQHAVRHGHITVRRGIWPRQELPAVRVEVDCPETDRRVRLQLCPAVRKGVRTACREDLNRLLAALLQGLQCH